ncbi:MAG: SHOCT domain-containing protein [Sulfuricella sp.]|nr:SHOCT domain-containing protein [Gammaproteobacteria bacterium]
MMGWTDGYGWMGLGWIFMALFWVLIILGIVALLRWLGMGGNGSRDVPRKTPLEILQERYARGEIEREEYEQKRRDLEG